ncbi:hypothetical protein AVEN_133785-1 [Araneus ventricosus]|uniref:Uncharacterized protein n=1 Tax=Araneus ventricosus TaxID=182803 RepID=A0A4Y2L3A6_ARAVE|nr:hypothetical protein AVEN_133785-1 [Araneus ventricosus]
MPATSIFEHKNSIQGPATLHPSRCSSYKKKSRLALCGFTYSSINITMAEIRLEQLPEKALSKNKEPPPYNVMRLHKEKQWYAAIQHEASSHKDSTCTRVFPFPILKGRQWAPSSLHMTARK